MVFASVRQDIIIQRYAIGWMPAVPSGDHKGQFDPVYESSSLTEGVPKFYARIKEVM